DEEHERIRKTVQSYLDLQEQYRSGGFAHVFASKASRRGNEFAASSPSPTARRPSPRTQVLEPTQLFCCTGVVPCYRSQYRSSQWLLPASSRHGPARYQRKRVLTTSFVIGFS